MTQSGHNLNTWVGTTGLSGETLTADNLATAFTPTKPMYTPGTNTDRLVVLLDVPKKLEQALAKGMQKIGPRCLRENAEVVLKVFEDMCLEHVVGQEIADKLLRKLTQHNPTLPGSTASTTTSHGNISKSSLLGKDPWGDEVIPDKKQDEDGKDIEYTDLQLLLFKIQNKTHSYLTAHLSRIVHPAIMVKVKEMEMKYEENVDDLRTDSPRNRMPWSKYKTLVLQYLPKGSGLYELSILLSLTRENGESVGRWIQRITIGKSLLERKDNSAIKLPDAVYSELALRYLTGAELHTMALAHQRAKEGIGAQTPARAGGFTPEEAKYQLSELSWVKLTQLIKSSVRAETLYNIKQHLKVDGLRLFTLSQAVKQLKATGYTISKRERKRGSKKGSWEADPRECALCKKEGLSGSTVRHATDKCNARIRKRNVAAMKRNRGRSSQGGRTQVSGKRKWSNSRGKGGSNRLNSALECSICKSAGRRYRHPQDKCKYAPGGEWHGLSKEELHKKHQEHFKMKEKNSRENSTVLKASQVNPRKKTRAEYQRRTGCKKR